MALKPVSIGLDVATNAGTYNGTLHDLIVLTRATYGHGLGKHAKFYDGGNGIQATYRSMLASGYGDHPSETAPYMCWRGNFVEADFIDVMTRCVAQFTAKTGVPVWVCNDQEWENKSITPAQYMDKVKAQAAAIAKTPALVGKVQVVPCTMAYQELIAKNQTLNWKTCVQPVAGLCSAISWDFYEMDFDPPSFPLVNYLDQIKAASQTLKLPYFLGEWGLCLSTKNDAAGHPDTQTARAARVKSVIDYLTADAKVQPARPYGALGGNWWENYQGLPNNPSQCPTGLVKDGAAGTPSPVLAVLQAAMN